MTDVSNDIMEVCPLTIRYDNMAIYPLMVQVQQVEETMVKRKNRDPKRARFYEGTPSKKN